MKMPVLFVGHGSPMNAIESNGYTKTWKSLAEKIPTPEVILSISAHWFTRGTKIMNEQKSKTIYDMYGFPKELYDVTYGTAGSPRTAIKCKELITRKTEFDNSWGIDHGTWSVLVHMYPSKDIPVFQISIDADAPSETHYEIGRQLSILREQGVLIFGSGNVVHNLRMVDWGKQGKGYDWAHKFDDYICENIMQKNDDNVLKCYQQGDIARLSVPTPDHFDPLLYTLGASKKEDKISVFNKACEIGSLSMTGYLWE